MDVNSPISLASCDQYFTGMCSRQAIFIGVWSVSSLTLMREPGLMQIWQDTVLTEKSKWSPAEQKPRSRAWQNSQRVRFPTPVRKSLATCSNCRRQEGSENCVPVSKSELTLIVQDFTLHLHTPLLALRGIKCETVRFLGLLLTQQAGTPQRPCGLAVQNLLGARWGAACLHYIPDPTAGGTVTTLILPAALKQNLIIPQEEDVSFSHSLCLSPPFFPSPLSPLPPSLPSLSSPSTLLSLFPCF